MSKVGKASSDALFTRFVEIGRVGLINYGEDEGKLCTILDVVDQNRVLVDGPVSLTGARRQVLSLKRLSLTDFKVPLNGPGARSKFLVKQFTAADILNKWNKTSWAKKRAARAARANLTDFDRYKLYRYQTKRSAVERRTIRGLKAQHREKKAKK